MGIDWSFWSPVVLGGCALILTDALLCRWLRRWWQRLLLLALSALIGYVWFVAWVGAHVARAFIKLLGG